MNKLDLMAGTVALEGCGQPTEGQGNITTKMQLKQQYDKNTIFARSE